MPDSPDWPVPCSPEDLVGPAEPIQRYGVTLTEAEAKALAERCLHTWEPIEVVGALGPVFYLCGRCGKRTP